MGYRDRDMLDMRNMRTKKQSGVISSFLSFLPPQNSPPWFNPFIPAANQTPQSPHIPTLQPLTNPDNPCPFFGGSRSCDEDAVAGAGVAAPDLNRETMGVLTADGAADGAALGGGGRRGRRCPSSNTME